jgi:hypothetical protein
MRTNRLALAGALALLAACQDHPTTADRTKSAVPRSPVGVFSQPGEVRTGWITGADGTPVQVTFEVHDGRAIFEGDIDLGPAASIPATREEAAARPGGPRYGVIRTSGWWQSGTVVFSIDPAFNAAQRQTILDALNHIHTLNPGVTFHESTYYSTRIHFRLSTDVCSSPVGRQGGIQNVKLTSGCAYALPTIVHETLHSLGVQHEQTRCDRDYYVRINWQNIKSGYAYNFERNCSGHRDIGEYDEGSVMHYDAYAASANGFPTIESLRGRALGAGPGLSAGDVRTLDYMYPRPMNVSAAYPGNVPSITWAAYPEATRYEVYRVVWERVTNPIDVQNNRSSEQRSLVGITAGTSLSDPSGTYTGVSYCSYEYGYDSVETGYSYEVWAFTPYVSAGVQKGYVGAEIAPC